MYPASTALLLALSFLHPTVGFPQSPAPISVDARKQIAEILAIKDSFTPAEKKLSSNLAFASRKARGLPVGSAADLIDWSKMSDGLVEVDIHARVTERLLQAIAANAGRVKSQWTVNHQLRASLALTSLHVLAEVPGVLSIQEADHMMLNVGALTSQGYVTHRAKPVIEGGITGAGVKVGVLSDSASASRVTTLMASGDLGPNTTVLAGLASSGSDEGTAMMEIVQDIAPGAQIFFATANGGQPAFANNISALAAAGCSIIVDDITYFAEPAFQDGPIAQSINTFVAAGGLYFSSAANSGNLTSGTAGTWEGDFLDGGALSGPVTAIDPVGRFHNFGTTGSTQNFDNITLSSAHTSLKWSDPTSGSTNDYDLFILNSTGTTVKGFSATAQTGTQDPYESVSLTTVVGDRIVIVLHTGTARALRVDTNRGQLGVATAGSTFGHNGAPNTVTVAATAWNSARSGTQPFNGANNAIETFSSDGPRKLFYNPDGSAITPGNFLFASNGGATFPKPDLTAADGVSCKTPGFLPFFGTSAAAPHAAGIAALVKSANPSLTGAQIRAILINTAADNMAPGRDRDGGAGIVNAQAAVQAALAQ